jgi:uncharacterized membrane protein
MNHHLTTGAVDSRQRTLVKTLTYRLLGMGITAAVAWFLTREVYFAASLGVLDTVVKLGGYYLHERAWELTSFGRGPSSRPGRVTNGGKENRKWRRLTSLKRTYAASSTD